MTAANLIFIFTAVVMLVGLAGFVGAVVASFRVRKVEGRPAKAYNSDLELVITGALCGAGAGSIVICFTSLKGWLNIAL
jgi:hypothetical protein